MFLRIRRVEMSVDGLDLGLLRENDSQSLRRDIRNEYARLERPGIAVVILFVSSQKARTRPIRSYIAIARYA